ncbi:leucyl aminopeptidase family protein [Phenylobacterium montanum]|uniref:M17 family metallopeptidase n=1 Tax=Phenylobacterium montanum TaxID=2823693 RepID=A0A975FY99_9CAUL|nr:M17 family metallopeptidase [Caulobacter sp. S6]QUD87042.1 M17 family metallopeptidase [Caulobacter sp. S6]
MSDTLLAVAEGPAIAVHALLEADLAAFMDGRSAPERRLVDLAQFKAKAGQVLAVPGDGGDMVLFGLGAAASPDGMAFRALPGKLPPGDYHIATAPAAVPPQAVALAWALGAYAFERYRKPRKEPWPRLVTQGVDLAEVKAIAEGCALARDLVNTPANDMGPVQLEMAARETAEAFGAEITVITGEALLTQGYPAVHAVGRAADPTRAPRMIELRWGRPEDPLVALVGKGVVFDTGGLDLKPSAGMRLMKKDMGGAAHALGLAHMIMAMRLKLRLAVLLPVVENAVSGDAMRPGDVIASRKGLSIEIGNTDAEGRLILADALTRAEELEPALTIDLATLTGAARAALGPQVIPFYTADEALAGELAQAATTVADPLWRMPLWAGYDEALDSDIADLKNDSDAWAQAGSVTAALFLQRFAPKGPWAHFDIFAWNPKGGAGRPTGAEAQAIRALYAVLKARQA